MTSREPFGSERKGAEAPPGAPSEPVRAEEHVRLARYALRGLTRPEEEEDDFGAAVLVLVQAAQAWNAGKVTCAWTTHLVSRVRWGWIRQHFNRGKPRRVPEVPLFLVAPDDEEAEIERPEMAVEDPELRAAEARADVEALLEGLTAGEALVLRRRFGIGGTEPLTREAVGEELGVWKERIRTIESKALARLRKRAGRRTFTIPLDSARSERLR